MHEDMSSSGDVTTQCKVWIRSAQRTNMCNVMWCGEEERQREAFGESVRWQGTVADKRRDCFVKERVVMDEQPVMYERE